MHFHSLSHSRLLSSQRGLLSKINNLTKAQLVLKQQYCSVTLLIRKKKTFSNHGKLEVFQQSFLSHSLSVCLENGHPDIAAICIQSFKSGDAVKQSIMQPAVGDTNLNVPNVEFNLLDNYDSNFPSLPSCQGNLSFFFIFILFPNKNIQAQHQHDYAEATEIFPPKKCIW